MNAAGQAGVRPALARGVKKIHMDQWLANALEWPLRRARAEDQMPAIGDKPDGASSVVSIGGSRGAERRGSLSPCAGGAGHRTWRIELKYLGGMVSKSLIKQD